MSKLWSIFSIIVGTIGFIYSIILFGAAEFMVGMACLISTFFSSAILYSIGEYFYRNDRMQEMLLLIYQELKNEKQKITSYHEEGNKEGHNKRDLNKGDHNKEKDDRDIITESHKDVSLVKPIIDGLTITCPRCNTIQRIGRSVCWECGTKFESDDTEYDTES